MANSRLRSRLLWAQAATVVALTAAVISGQGNGGGQTPPQTLPPGTGLIVGQVIDGTTGQPVGGSLVTMTASAVAKPATSAAPLAGAQATSQNVYTDSSGRFVFHHLPKATYELTASNSGYTDGRLGQRRPAGPGRTLDLEADQRFTDATIRIWKQASLTGSVVDEYGEPIVGVTVRLLRRALVSGRRRLTPSSSATTDDRGVYRFSLLNPGDYIVAIPASVATIPTAVVDQYAEFAAAKSIPNADPAALALITTNMEAVVQFLRASGAPSPAGTGRRVGNLQLQYSSALSRLAPAPNETGRIFAYQTTFYPTSVVETLAEVISLGSGEDRTAVDLQMRLVATSRVSGIVTGPEGPAPNMGLKLVPMAAQDWTADSGYETATTATDEQGRFTFFGVPAGQYVLRAQRLAAAGSSSGSTSPTLWAEVPVSSTGTDVANVVVTLRAGVRVSGRVEFDGAAALPAPDRLQQININLVTADGRSKDRPQQVRVGAGGQFATQQHVPGKYTVTASSAGGPWILKSIMAGGRDVSHLALSLESNDIGGVVVTYTDRPTQLSGSVQGVAAPEIEALVVVFPANVQQWTDSGMNSRVSRTGRPAKTGAFSFTNLPIGEYLVAALPDERSVDWQEAATLAKIAAAASRTSIADGDKKTITLTVLPIK